MGKRNLIPQKRIPALLAHEFLLSFVKTVEENTPKGAIYLARYIRGIRVSPADDTNLRRLRKQDIVLEDYLEQRLDRFGLSIHDFNLFLEERSVKESIQVQDKTLDSST